MMSPADLQSYLHEHIPLSKAMSVKVVSVCFDTVTLSAPLQPNINHRETVFGGSASALAILSAWCLVHTRLKSEGITSRLVIHENSMSYDKPITGEFTAVSRLQDEELWPRFKAMLHRKGKARISVTAELMFQGDVTGRFTGEFVALGGG